MVHKIALMAQLPCPPSQGEGVAIKAQGYAGDKGRIINRARVDRGVQRVHQY